MTWGSSSERLWLRGSRSRSIKGIHWKFTKKLTQNSLVDVCPVRFIGSQCGLRLNKPYLIEGHYNVRPQMALYSGACYGPFVRSSGSLLQSSARMLCIRKPFYWTVSKKRIIWDSLGTQIETHMRLTWELQWKQFRQEVAVASFSNEVFSERGKNQVLWGSKRAFVFQLWLLIK